MTQDDGEITRLLQAGDSPSRERVIPLVYEELRAIARQRMSRERNDHTLQATALVHEAYARLIGNTEMNWEDRGHFYAAAAQAMRRVLVDHARRVGAEKRGGDRIQVTLGTAEAPVEMEQSQVIALDAAIQQLEEQDPRAAEVTKLRFLVGLSVIETALALNVSERTVEREWTFAKARLTAILKTP